MGRYLLNARVRDIEKRRLPSKYYVYVIHVSWSDGSITIIYRRYSKFFDFHMKIMSTFQVEAGIKTPSQRSIPFLPGKKVFGRSHTREVALKRLDQLDDYCQHLVKLPGKISNCEDVIQFFSPTPDDINPPSFTEEVKGSSSSAIDEISDPIQAQQYRVVADYKKQQKNEVELFAGDVVEVFEKNENGWWFVSVQDSQGWAPGTFLARVDGKDDEEESISGNDAKYITNNRYQADQEDELSFETGVVVTVHKKSLDGWWKIKHLEKEGWVPATYLQPYSGPDATHTPPVEVIGNVMSISKLTLSNSPQMGRVNKFQPNAQKGRGDNRFNTEAKPTPPRRSTVRRVRRDSSTKGHQMERKKSAYLTTEAFDGPSTAEGCVSFQKNMVVEVIQQDDVWWLIKVGGKEGWAPASYISATKSEPYVTPMPAAPPAIDPQRGGSNVSVDSETGAPRGPESPKFRKPQKGNLFQEDGDKKVGGRVSGGAFTPYQRDAPPPPPAKPAAKKADGRPAPPAVKTKPSKTDLRPASEVGPVRPPPADTPQTEEQRKSISQIRRQLEQSLGANGSSSAGSNAGGTSNAGGDSNTKRPASSVAKGDVYRTIAPFEDDEGLNFGEGIEVLVIEKDVSGWWNVMIGPDEGWVPSTYLRPV